ncbi:MaoC family dehydratase [Pontibacter sp. G13]|uniref:MaoC family dehydratase n=1 Tax=Pontibacter sp. G13 TaxID=3074898 RepID=UPI00288984DF|nr:MaoC family dehydratase [Pontibacter sp. G13]WNJ18007.1 MaoC family dehydratase [Pontibacter sp. G13]
MLQEGQTYEQSFSFSQSDVDTFAQISGDKNPIHIDAEYAANTPYKRPIIHGFLGGSIISKILGMDFPGEGTVYLKQEMSFRKPMFVDTPYKAVITVEEVSRTRHIATLKTAIVNEETGKPVLTGKAQVMHAEKI